MCKRSARSLQEAKNTPNGFSIRLVNLIKSLKIREGILTISAFLPVVFQSIEKGRGLIRQKFIQPGLECFHKRILFFDTFVNFFHIYFFMPALHVF